MLNRVVLVGRITKDPDVRYTGDVPRASFTIAVNRPVVGSNGERQADFIQCVAWRKQAENMEKYVKKGALLGIDGRLQTRTYEAENGTRYITEVVCDSVQFLDTKSSQDASGVQSYNSREVQNSRPEPEEDPFYSSSKKLNVSEEDLPF